MRAEAWAYVSGLAAARENAFFSRRAIEELASLRPDELRARLSRSFFGSVEPLSAFDRFARERRDREFDEIEELSPANVVVPLVRVGFAADAMRRRLGEIPEGADQGMLVRILQNIGLAAGELADDFRRKLAGPLPPPGDSARQAASLLIDSAELLLVVELAEKAGDRLISEWSRVRVQTGCAKVSLRAVKLGVSEVMLSRFFFRGRLMGKRAEELLKDYDEQAAMHLYPPGAVPGREDEAVFGTLDGAVSEPFSAARVLRYLLGFLRQENMLRRAVYTSLGRLRGRRAA